MCVEMRRHIARQIAATTELLVGACNEAQIQATAAREYGPHDVFEIDDAGNPVRSTLRYEPHDELIRSCRHAANSR